MSIPLLCYCYLTDRGNKFQTQFLLIRTEFRFYLNSAIMSEQNLYYWIKFLTSTGKQFPKILSSVCFFSPMLFSIWTAKFETLKNCKNSEIIRLTDPRLFEWWKMRVLTTFVWKTSQPTGRGRGSFWENLKNDLPPLSGRAGTLTWCWCWRRVRRRYCGFIGGPWLQLWDSTQ